LRRLSPDGRRDFEMPEWWETYFDSDYFKVYDFSQERTSREVDFAIDALKIEPPARILDLACGHGRHSIEFSKRGFDVTGLDLSEVFIEKARKDAERAQAKCEFVVGDMREIPYTAEFDAAVILFTSFGFFASEEDNQKVLDSAAGALRTRGKLLIDTINRDSFTRRWMPRTWSEHPHSGAILLAEHRFDAVTGRVEMHRKLMENLRVTREDTLSLRICTATELVSMLKDAGLTVFATWGNLEKSELTHESHRLIVADRKGE
jgi:SAM-dependent methyltransferase